MLKTNTIELTNDEQKGIILGILIQYYYLNKHEDLYLRYKYDCYLLNVVPISLNAFINKSNELKQTIKTLYHNKDLNKQLKRERYLLEQSTLYAFIRHLFITIPQTTEVLWETYCDLCRSYKLYKLTNKEFLALVKRAKYEGFRRTKEGGIL